MNQSGKSSARHGRDFALLLGLGLSAAPLLAAGPSFECTDGAGAKYALHLTPERKTLTVENRLGKREYPLSEPNLQSPVPAGSPIYYVGVVPEGKTVDSQFQMGTMVRTHLFRSEGRHVSSVDITLNHTRLAKLTCRTSHYSAAAPPGNDPKDLPKRLAEPLLLWGGRIRPNGMLDPLSLLACEASLMQTFHSGRSEESDFLNEYVELVGPLLRKMPPLSVETLKRRFTAKEKEFLEVALDLAGYPYYPEVQRYADWITEGLTRPGAKGAVDWNQVHAGFRSFFSSKAFAAVDMRAFFEGELRKSLLSLDPITLAQFTEGMKPEEEQFVVKAWTSPKKADYAALKETFPLLKVMQQDLTRPLKPEETGHRSQFTDFATGFAKLLRLSAMKNPAVLSHLRAWVPEHLEPLDPKELRALVEQLPAVEKQALADLRKSN